MTRSSTKRRPADEDVFLNAGNVGREDADPESFSDFIDWEELAEDGAAILISVVELGEMEDTEYGEKEPWIGRVIVLTGEDAGEVYNDVKIFKGGIANKCEAAGEQSHVIGRLGFYEVGEGRKKREYVGLNGARSRDKELAKSALAKYGRPWDRNGKAATNGHVKDEDEDEKPARTTRSRARARDDDDEDEKPARATRSRARAAKDDDDEPPARASRSRRGSKAEVDTIEDDEPPARATRSRRGAKKTTDDEPPF